MKVNVDKCKVLTISHSKTIDYKYSLDTEHSGKLELERVDKMKDLGVTIDVELNFKDHIYDKINKAYQMLGIINLDRFSFLMLYKSWVRSQVEYANAVWCPYKDDLVTDIERVQKRATKMVKGLNKLAYKERLISLQLPTLRLCRLRGDMIEVYKILTGGYDVKVCPPLLHNGNIRARGNSKKLETLRSKYDVRKYSFSSRIVKICNSLPDKVITGAL